MSEWNKYVKELITNGNKVTVKKIKKPTQLEQVVEDKQ